MKKILLILLPFLLNTHFLFGQEETFSTDVKAKMKPWNHLDFYNNPENFQFAIVSDRTGGHREGIFNEAVDKLNLILPEMVLSVGDLIEGYTDNKEELEKQWTEFNSMVEKLKMPFFYLPGNHDVSNIVMKDEWEKRFGRRYYHFLYKNVLFLLLDSNEEDGDYLSAEQVNYFKGVIAKNKNVRWTFLFMHHPIWNDENVNSFEELEKSLVPSKYTVFAGHTHEYLHGEHNKSNYYVLSTTGGGSKLRGPQFGEFDHITWVTMTDNGPSLANIELKGILSDDIYNAEKDRLAKDLLKNSNFEKIVLLKDTTKFSKGSVYLRFENTTKDTLNLYARFNHNHQLKISKSIFDENVLPNSEKIIEVAISSNKDISFDEIEHLSFNWTLKYLQNKEITLDGQTTILIEPQTPSVITNRYNIFVESAKVKIDKRFKNLNYQITVKEIDSRKEVINNCNLKETSDVEVNILNAKGETTKTERKLFKKVKLDSGIGEKNDLELGLKYKYYEGKWEKIPDFSKLDELSSGVVEKVDLKLLKTAIDHFGIVFEGYVNIENDGLYEFKTYSDDGSKLFINGKLVVNNDGSHAAKNEYGLIGLKKGLHKMTLEYFEDFEGEALEVGFKSYNQENESYKVPQFYYEAE